MDDINENEDEHYRPFYFINALPSLQSTAATQLALSLWKYKYFDQCANGTDPNDSFLKKEFSIDEVISVPSCIGKIIDAKIELMRVELKRWIAFNSKPCYFCSHVRFDLSKHFEDIICEPNGTGINYKQTALRLLRGDKLSTIEKYKLACETCLEEEIYKIWPLVSEDLAVLAKCNYSKSHDSMMYWVRRMQSPKSNQKILNRITISYNERNWPSFKYFWNQLTDEKKLAKAIAYLKRQNMDDATAGAAISILPTLNKTHAQRVFEQAGSNILQIILLQNDEWIQYLPKLLIVDMEEVISETCFYDILMKLYKTVFNYSNADRKQCNRIVVLIQEMWTNAPNHLKLFVRNEKVDQFFIQLSFRPTSIGFQHIYGHDITFILNLLSGLSSQRKEEIFQKYWRKLILRSKPSYMRQLIELCSSKSSSDEEIQARQSFKYNVLISKDTRLFTLLIESDMYSDLRDYANFCSTDSEAAEEMIKRILNCNFKSIINKDNDKWVKFEEFIGEMFTNVKDTNTFKESLITSIDALRYFRDSFMEGSLNDFFNNKIYRFIKTQKRLNKMREKLLECCRYYEFRGILFGVRFSTNNWRKLIKWCTNGDFIKISTFKQSLDIDEVFAKLILLYVDNKRLYRQLTVTDCIDYFRNFLQWYYENEKDKRDFENRILEHYNVIKSTQEPSFDFVPQVASTSVDQYPIPESIEVHQQIKRRKTEYCLEY